jgi:hypothetical protein
MARAPRGFWLIVSLALPVVNCAVVVAAYLASRVLHLGTVGLVALLAAGLAVELRGLARWMQVRGGASSDVLGLAAILIVVETPALLFGAFLAILYAACHSGGCG